MQLSKLKRLAGVKTVTPELKEAAIRSLEIHKQKVKLLEEIVRKPVEHRNWI